MLKAPIANLVFNAVQSTFQEVVDTIYDALRAGYIIEDALEDGWQFTDLLSVMKINPIVSEIVNDVPVFVDQFTKLTPATAIAAVQEAKLKLEGEAKVGKVTGFIIVALTELAESYAFAKTTYDKAELRLESIKGIIGSFSESK